jgi:hypothetical protein
MVAVVVRLDNLHVTLLFFDWCQQAAWCLAGDQRTGVIVVDDGSAMGGAAEARKCFIGGFDHKARGHFFVKRAKVEPSAGCRMGATIGDELGRNLIHNLDLPPWTRLI